MSKEIFIFILFTFFGHVYGSDQVWIFGSAINTTYGTEEAVYCRVRNPADEVVFEDFGPCKIVVNRVTTSHEGTWKMNIGETDRVVAVEHSFKVSVIVPVPDPPHTIVTTEVFVNETSTKYTCFVPEKYEIRACKFRDPRDPSFIMVASPPVRFPGNANYDGSFKSVVTPHMCSVEVNTIVTRWNQGIWRCEVETNNGTHYGFLTVEAPWTSPPSYPVVSDIHTVPRLKMRQNSYNITEGDRPVFFCYVDAPLRYCYFTAPNGTTYPVRPGISSPDYEYVGNGFEAGECGVRFKGLRATDSGNWQCQLGLHNTTAPEERGDFSVVVKDKITVSHYYSRDGRLTVEGIVYTSPLEYCRFVRIDGFGFTARNMPLQNPHGYRVANTDSEGVCTLHIDNPTLLDKHPWTITAMVRGIDEEVWGRTTEDLLTPQRSYRSVIGGILFWVWVMFAGIMIFTAGLALIPKNNRQWTYAKASGVRNSFRRNKNSVRETQPPPYDHTVTNTQQIV